MNIFRKIGKSVFGPEFYESLKMSGTGLSIKYYIKLALLIAIIPTVFSTFFILPSVRAYLSADNVKNLVAVYPEELNLKAKDGQFSTNVTEPYYLAFPEGFWEDDLKEGERQIDNIAVIDTRVESFSSEILYQYKTLAFITKDSVIIEKDGGLQVLPLSNYKSLNYDLNRQGIENLALKFLPIAKVLAYFIPVFVFAGYFMGYVWSLIPLLLLALIIWLVLIIKKSSRGFKYAYRITIHAVTLGLLLDVVYSLIFRGSINWFVLAIITLVVTLLNVKKESIVADISPEANIV